MVRQLRVQGSSFQFTCLQQQPALLGSKAQAGEPGQVDVGAFFEEPRGRLISVQWGRGLPENIAESS